MSGSYSKSDVSSHNKADNLWIIVDEDVYDLTKFQGMFLWLSGYLIIY